MIPSRYSFRLISRKGIRQLKEREAALLSVSEENVQDGAKRSFLKLAGLIGVGIAATQMLPKKAEALVFGGTPASSTVGLKNTSNVPVNPATEDTLAGVVTGLKILKKTVPLSGNGTLVTAGSQKIRVYNLKFSLAADLTSVSFNFGSNAAFETYLSPKSGGLYGANNQPNFVEGATGEDLKVTISGAASFQVNIDYLLI